MGLQILSPETPIEKTYFVVPKFALTVVGCWPQEQAPTWGHFLLFLVSSFATAFGAFGECIYGALTLDQILDSMDAWCPGITKQISFFKMLIFFVHRAKLFSLIDRIRKLLTEDEDKEKLKIVQRLSASVALLSGILLLSGNSTNLSFNLRPLVDMAYRSWTGQNISMDLPFKMKLPDVLTHYPVYPITYIWLAYTGLTTVFTFSGVDGCFLGLCFYISALFKMIQYDVRSLFLQLQAREWDGARDNRIVRQKLKVIIRRHNEVIDLCCEFVDIFTTIIMGHFLSAALVLCISAINFLFNTGFGLLLYVCYSIAALTQLFLYCIGGSYVADSSVGICDSMYLVEWYKCDAETRRMILMIMVRAQRATSVRVPFFSPSLPAFMAILSTAGSYIALMKSFI